MVLELFEGASFGELALIYKKPRAATIKVHTDTYLATLSKKDFHRILKSAEEERIIRSVNYF